MISLSAQLCLLIARQRCRDRQRPEGGIGMGQTEAADPVRRGKGEEVKTRRLCSRNSGGSTKNKKYCELLVS